MAMKLINELKHIHRKPGQTEVPLRAARRTLAKKLWRGQAQDGAEFGFELAAPLAPDTVFHEDGEKIYVARQEPEPILVVALPDSADDAARLGWKMGNLHVPVQVEAGRLMVADDPGMRQSLARQHIAFTAAEGVFRPLGAGHGHDHDDHEH